MNSCRRFNQSLLLKNSLSAKWLYLPILILSILWTTYTYATTINSKNLVPTQTKKYIEVTVGIEHATLWEIASWANRKHKLGYKNLNKLVWEIEQENGVTPVIQVGQKLRIPVEVEK